MLAAREGGLELAAEVLNVVVTEQELEQCVRVGGDVEGLGVTDPSQGAGGDVAHRVAAGLTGGDAHGGQPAHQIGGVLDVDEVELEVLPGGHVQDAVGILLGKFGQHLELVGIQASEGHLDAVHPGSIPFGVGSLGEVGRKLERLDPDAVVAVTVVVALAVGPPAKPRLGEDLLVDLVAAPEFHLPFEAVDLLGPVRRHLALQLVLPGGHDSLPTSIELGPPGGAEAPFELPREYSTLLHVSSNTADMGPSRGDEDRIWNLRTWNETTAGRLFGFQYRTPKAAMTKMP